MEAGLVVVGQVVKFTSLMYSLIVREAATVLSILEL